MASAITNFPLFLHMIFTKSFHSYVRALALQTFTLFVQTFTCATGTPSSVNIESCSSKRQNKLSMTFHQICFGHVFFTSRSTVLNEMFVFFADLSGFLHFRVFFEWQYHSVTLVRWCHGSAML
uniref:(northern house mosquito) hypothetical protein n=1 Tax=Culex pipiens TaxID=7175 RepID=A0A8D8A556_CULPI